MFSTFETPAPTIWQILGDLGFSMDSIPASTQHRLVRPLGPKLRRSTIGGRDAHGYPFEAGAEGLTWNAIDVQEVNAAETRECLWDLCAFETLTRRSGSPSWRSGASSNPWTTDGPNSSWRVCAITIFRLARTSHTLRTGANSLTTKPRLRTYTTPYCFWLLTEASELVSDAVLERFASLSSVEDRETARHRLSLAGVDEGAAEYPALFADYTREETIRRWAELRSTGRGLALQQSLMVTLFEELSS